MIYSLLRNNFSNIQGIDCTEDAQTFRISYSGKYLAKEPIYYAVSGNDLIFSYDFFEIVMCYQEHNSLVINKGVLPFFLNKGYSPFDYTFIENIYKLPNMTEMIVDKKKFKILYEFCQRDTKYENASDCDIIEKSIIDCLDPEHKTVVLFSGGYDSTLIALIAGNYCGSDNVELVTGRMIGANFKPNMLDAEYSQKIASVLGLKLNIVDVNIDTLTKDDLDSIIFNQPNTAHFSIVFGGIRDSYKTNDCNFISGQQADSILNFGSTSFLKFSNTKIEGIGELLRRVFYLSDFKLANSIFKALNRRLNKKYVQLALVCGYKKFPIIKNIDLYDNYISLYEPFTLKYKNRNLIVSSFHLFYLFTHLSGSDASGVLSNFASAKNPLPFNNVELIKHYSNKKYRFADKWIPKKPIMDKLKEHKIIWRELSLRPNTPNSSYLDVFYYLASKLDLMNYYKKAASEYQLDIPFCYNGYHLFRCLDEIYGKK